MFALTHKTREFLLSFCQNQSHFGLYFCLAHTFLLLHEKESIAPIINKDAQNKYSSDAGAKYLIDTVQTQYQCCGVLSYKEWLGNSFSWINKEFHFLLDDKMKTNEVSFPPWSCFNDTTSECNDQYQRDTPMPKGAAKKVFKFCINSHGRGDSVARHYRGVAIAICVLCTINSINIITKTILFRLAIISN